jgi:hypothetical protein
MCNDLDEAYENGENDVPAYVIANAETPEDKLSAILAYFGVVEGNDVERVILARAILQNVPIAARETQGRRARLLRAFWGGLVESSLGRGDYRKPFYLAFPGFSPREGYDEDCVRLETTADNDGCPIVTDAINAALVRALGKKEECRG